MLAAVSTSTTNVSIFAMVIAAVLLALADNLHSIMVQCTIGSEIPSKKSGTAFVYYRM